MADDPQMEQIEAAASAALAAVLPLLNAYGGARAPLRALEKAIAGIKHAAFSQGLPPA